MLEKLFPIFELVKMSCKGLIFFPWPQLGRKKGGLHATYATISLVAT